LITYFGWFFKLGASPFILKDVLKASLLPIPLRCLEKNRTRDLQYLAADMKAGSREKISWYYKNIYFTFRASARWIEQSPNFKH
jgi:hypothetical protein